VSEYRITVLPSGHQFHAVEEETLLEAALRSGLNIDFSCASGNCGECHARLLEGQLGHEEHHDFSFTVSEKAQGMFLLCSAHAAGDLVIEAGEAKSPRDIPRQRVITRIHKIEGASECLRIVHLKTPRTQPLRFLAGQHVQLTLPGVGALDASIGSCPCNGSLLQFHIPYDGENPMVRQIFDGLRRGAEIELDGPFGEMTLDDDSPRPLLVVAQGHELAPMKSIIEHAINLDLGQPIRFIWLAHEGEHYMENFCRSWGEALDDYKFLPLTARADENDVAQAGVAVVAICNEIEDLLNWDVYWAGSDSFNVTLERALMEAGADGERLFYPRRRAFERSHVEVASG